MLVDWLLVRSNVAPRWYLKLRAASFIVTMATTLVLLSFYKTKLHDLQRRDDPNRVEGLKSAK